MAGGTAGWIFAFRSAAPFAGAAGILAGNLYLRFEAEGRFAERNFQIVAQIRTPFRASAPPPPENIAEPEEFAEYVAEVAKRVEEERRGVPRKLILMGLLLFVGGILSFLVWVYLPAVFWLPIWIVATVAAILGVVSLVSGLALFVSDRF